MTGDGRLGTWKYPGKRNNKIKTPTISKGTGPCQVQEPFEVNLSFRVVLRVL